MQQGGPFRQCGYRRDDGKPLVALQLRIRNPRIGIQSHLTESQHRPLHVDGGSDKQGRLGAEAVADQLEGERGVLMRIVRLRFQNQVFGLHAEGDDVPPHRFRIPLDVRVRRRIDDSPVRSLFLIIGNLTCL